MKRWTGAFLLAAAVACGSQGDPARPAGARADSPRGGVSIAEPTRGEYAVVSRGVDFFVAPRADAAHFRLRREPRAADPSEDFAAGAVVKVLGARAGWVEVENQGTDELAAQHCLSGIGALDAFHLRVFVRAGAIAPVLARRYTRTYPDGTAVDLLPGLPLGGLGARGRHLSKRAFGTLHLDLPGELVGRSYAAARAPGVAATFRTAAEQAEQIESQETLSSDAHLSAGPHTVVIDGAMMARLRPAAKGILVELADPCARLTALAARSDVGVFGIGGGKAVGYGAKGYGRVTDHDTRYLYPGVALFWEDGSPAGTARAEREYDLWQEHPTRKELACVVHDLLEPGDPNGPNEAERRARPRAATEIVLCFRYDETGYRRNPAD